MDLSDHKNLEINLKTLFDTITSNGKNKINHIAFTAGDQLGHVTLDTVTAENYFDTAGVRIVGPILVTKIGREYLALGDSSITFTSGTMAYKPTKDYSVLGSWGMTIEGLVKGTAVALGPEVRVNAVAPGAILTPMLEKFIAMIGDKGMEFVKMNLLQRVGASEEIAEAYLYCMKDRFLTGHVVLSDGGRTLL